MNKTCFLNTLRERLSGLSPDDIEERLAFYEEMIDDRMEEGMTEEEAVAAAGTADSIAEQILSEIPLSRLVIDRVKPKKRWKAWEVVLLVLGAPVWIPLVCAAIVIVLAIYAVFWVLVACVYAFTLSLAASAVFSIPAALHYLMAGNPAGAFFLLGAGLALAGLSILMFLCSARITGYAVDFTKRFMLWIKLQFVKKEDTEHAYA